MRNKRSYYLPGIISLIGIFIFLNIYKGRFLSKTYTTLKIAVPSDKINDDPILYQFSLNGFEALLKKKKQIIITLDSNYINNNKKMELIKYEARNLKYTKDTTTLIIIKLSNELTYQYIIRLIDLCYADEHKRFTLLRNSFVIFGEHPPQKSIQTNLSIIPCELILPKSTESTLTIPENILNKIEPNMSSENLILSSGWIALVFCTFYFRKRKITPPPSSTP